LTDLIMNMVFSGKWPK